MIYFRILFFKLQLKKDKIKVILGKIQTNLLSTKTYKQKEGLKNLCL